jgi:hypothetical protein
VLFFPIEVGEQRPLLQRTPVRTAKRKAAMLLPLPKMVLRISLIPPI